MVKGSGTLILHWFLFSPKTAAIESSASLYGPKPAVIYLTKLPVKSFSDWGLQRLIYSIPPLSPWNLNTFHSVFNEVTNTCHLWFIHSHPLCTGKIVCAVKCFVSVEHSVFMTEKAMSKKHAFTLERRSWGLWWFSNPVIFSPMERTRVLNSFGPGHVQWLKNCPRMHPLPGPLAVQRSVWSDRSV